jgi:hypothetical protein
LQEFKEASKEAHLLDNYLRQVEVSAIAHFFAKKYNQRRKPGVSIRFLESHVVELQLSGGGSSRGALRYNAESLLPEGEFVKFCNNLGNWDLDRADRWLADFCKWDLTPTHSPPKDWFGVSAVMYFF